MGSYVGLAVLHRTSRVPPVTWLLCSRQIQKVILALGDYMGAACHACIGGTNVHNEMKKLEAEAPHIVVGTPGRVFDMMNRRYLCEFLPRPPERASDSSTRGSGPARR